MKKLATFIVDKRYFILATFILLAILCGWLSTQVNVNSDMSAYLPKDSDMKHGKEVLSDNFPEASVLRVMMKDVAVNKRETIQGDIMALEAVEDVQYALEDPAYNQAPYTLYEVIIGANSYSDAAHEVVDTLQQQYEQYDVILSGEAVGNTTSQLPLIATVAVIILSIILLMMSTSWIEPVLFLITIAIAILLNMGTDIIFDQVSDVTKSISSILQLVLSMDYSIMLLHRFRQEVEVTSNKYDAMKGALVNAFKAITSSAATTIVGLLMLVFMSFTIGQDLGFVLAKGILMSLISIFTVLPALILIFDTLIEKTRKKLFHINMDRLGQLSHKTRYLAVGVFIVLFVISFMLRGNTDITYTMSAFDEINKVFTPSNTMVLIYDNEDEAQVNEYLDKLSQESYITQVDAYGTSIGRPLNYEQMADTLSMDKSMLAVLYREYENQGDNPPVSLQALLGFIQSDIITNPQFASALDPKLIGQMGAGIPAEQLGAELTASQFSQMTGLDEQIVTLLYDYYWIGQGELPTARMGLDTFITYLLDDVVINPAYSSSFTPEAVQQLEMTADMIEEGKANLVSAHYGRAIIQSTLDDEGEATFDFIADLHQQLDGLSGKHYLVGNSPMAYEMNLGFHDELNYITILTAVAIFIVVAIAFRSLIIPLVLVAVIQTAVFVTMGSVTLQGQSINYLPLLIVQSLLMGATIDYAILYTSYYKEARLTFGRKEAIGKALNNAIHTILTSGLILIAITLVIGVLMVTADPAISDILMTIARGGLSAVILVVFFLPGIHAALDRFVTKEH